jgi:uncharacterized membrane protein
MNGNKHEVIALEERQRKLKKEVKQIKKRMPYYITGFFFFSFLIIGLFEGKLDKYIGDSINFIIIVGIVCCATCLVYLITLTKKVASKKKENKEIGSKLYRLMKLEESNLNE